MEELQKRQPVQQLLLLVILSGTPVVIHLLVNAFGGYGYFRDELYYIACSKHLAAGYVDQPPFSIFLMAGVRLLFGESIFAIRLIPAIASGLCVLLICLMVQRMKGGRSAMVIASLAFIASGQLLGFFAFYSMNSIDILIWTLAAYLIVRLEDESTLRTWLLLGVVLGIGLLNKTSVLWLGAGIGAGVLASTLRVNLKSRGPYLAAFIALLLFSPFIIWNLQHGLPHLEFMKNAVAMKYSSLTRMGFVIDQIKNMNPPTVVVSLLGLGWYLFGRPGRKYRALGIMFITVFAILAVNAHSKSEYIAAAYPMLFAGGGIAIERLPRFRRVATISAVALFIIFGLIVAPLALPILPVPTYQRYAQALGVAPSTPENKKLAELPQSFADMHGWEELARNISNAYLTIPAEERKTTVALVGNYGEAGALELFAKTYPLPRVICAHNAYWFWGVGDPHITTFIRLGGNRDDYTENYGSIELVGTHTCTYCMPYENKQNIFIVRQRRSPIDHVWAEYKHFE